MPNTRSANKLDLGVQKSFECTKRKKKVVGERKKQKSNLNQPQNNVEDIEDSSLYFKNKVGVENGKTQVWEPENWEIVFENLKEMRKNGDAPVDSMGCDKCKDDDSPDEVQRFHCLVSLMLSSQTKDEVTYAAMTRLKEKGLSVQNVVKMSEEDLGMLIKPVGFWKTKAKHIKQTSIILENDYNGDIPNTVDLLCKLPGVGPKMAHLCMKSAWGVISGIGVDVHVHRISNRLGWVKKETKTPELTRLELESWLPRQHWDEINHLLVGFGQQKCKAVNPNCADCKNLTYCSYGQKEVKTRRDTEDKTKKNKK